MYFLLLDSLIGQGHQEKTGTRLETRTGELLLEMTGNQADQNLTEKKEQKGGQVEMIITGKNVELKMYYLTFRLL